MTPVQLHALFGHAFLFATLTAFQGCPDDGEVTPTPQPACDTSTGFFQPVDAATLEPYTSDGTLTLNECEQLCPTSSSEADCWIEGLECCAEATSASGETGVSCVGPMICVGRRPEGFCIDRPGRVGTAAGRLFAGAARLEAASVGAFRTLERELRAHAAPEALILSARQAAREEVSHARSMSALARRYGSEARMPHLAPAPIRSLEALAMENATEGCVQETYGAMVGVWQSRMARDPAVRRVMRRIAADETRHAALAWQVDAWVSTRVDAAARMRINAARHDAVVGLQAQAVVAPAASLVRVAGLPGAPAAGLLVQDLRRSLWG